MTKSMRNADLQRLAAIVREVTGNSVQEKNLAMLESRLRTRMIKLGVDTIEEYWAVYAANEAEERQVLQSLMTTHYTFFFREFVHFEALEAWIDRNREQLKQRFAKSQTPFRVWSAACSRGQEVYSLAMFLESILLKKYGVKYEIYGTDIDQESVDYAKNGVYPIKEVTTIPAQYLAGCWRKGTGSVKDFAAVHPQLKENVKFSKLNLFETKSFAADLKFDVIFARNVFIYFSPEDVQAVAHSLKDRLLDPGLLISGVSEPLRFDSWTLESIGPSVYEKSKSRRPVAPTRASPPGPTSTPAPASIKPAPVKKATPYRVLCVDDSGTIQTLIKKIFSLDADCLGVVEALNGEEARSKLKTQKFDLITLDIHMPVMGGIEFLEKAYKKNDDPPVLMISSVSRKDVDLATKAMALGAFDYVEKPAMNNLQKSSDEILTKARMALRHRGMGSANALAKEFDQTISEKIVVPDASQCVRWIRGSQQQWLLLQPILAMLSAEYRSPPTVIAAREEDLAFLEGRILSSSGRPLLRVHEAKQLLKPNHIYLCSLEKEPEILAALKVKSLSLQITTAPDRDLSIFARFKDMQLLIDETVRQSAEVIVRECGLRASDITPSTSFVSLSLEYFANIRKSEAA